MLSFLPFFMSWGLPALCAAGAVAALVFAPPGAKRVLLEVCAVVGVASAVYGHGARYEQALCEARLAAIDAANLKAIADAQSRERARSAAESAEAARQIDALAQQKEAADADAADLRKALEKMAADDPGAANAPLPPLLLRAIRGSAR